MITYAAERQLRIRRKCIAAGQGPFDGTRHLAEMKLHAELERCGLPVQEFDRFLALVDGGTPPDWALDFLKAR